MQHANDTEIAALFTPFTSKNEAAVNATIPDRYQDVIINLAPLKTEREEYSKVQIDFLDHSITVRRTKFLSGPQGSTTWIGKPENVNGSALMAICGNALSIKNVKLAISQFRDSVCNGSIKISSDKRTLYKEESDEITVTVTGGDDNPSVGETVNATVNTAGKKRVSVSPSSGITDSSGQATFTITALRKKGIARVNFKSGCLKKPMTVKVK